MFLFVMETRWPVNVAVKLLWRATSYHEEEGKKVSGKVNVSFNDVSSTEAVDHVTVERIRIFALIM